MSLKAIDLQFAVHRNSDAGFIQNQTQQKPVQDQALLASQQTKKAAEERRRSAKTEEAGHSGIKDTYERGGKRRPAAYAKKGQPEEKDPQEPDHPYKGRHIDITY